MDRVDILKDLKAHGADPGRCAELAKTLGMLASDLLVVAGHPVPADLLPPERDLRVVREFAYRVSYCDHAQLAALVTFIHTLPATLSKAPAEEFGPPNATSFAAVLNGLLRNRGFGPRELPFTGLSLSTIHKMLRLDRHDEHRWPTLSKMAGPLGWEFLDLIAVAGEPLSDRPRPVIHCRHLGQVYTAAIRLTTEQLIESSEQADRLSRRPDQGAWRPVSEGFAAECPDLQPLTRGAR